MLQQNFLQSKEYSYRETDLLLYMFCLYGFLYFRIFIKQPVFLHARTGNKMPVSSISGLQAATVL